MNPKISVIVPIWGVEKYIEKCARSLFESDLEDMEFIFVDDCTPDKSIEILAALMEDYPERKKQSKIVKHDVNKGLPQARKTGFEASSGEWITYCDSDDWVSKNMYRTMLEKGCKEGCDMVCCDFVFLSDERILWKPKYIKENGCNNLREDLLSCKVSNAVWNKIVRREVYQKQSIFFPIYSMDEDDVLTVQLAYYSGNIGYIHEVLYYHYANPDSMTHQKSKEKIDKGIREKIENQKWIINFLESCNDKFVEEAIYNYKYSVKKLYYRLTKCNSFNIYKEINSNMLCNKNNTLLNTISNFFFLYIPSVYSIIESFIKFGGELKNRLSI